MSLFNTDRDFSIISKMIPSRSKIIDVGCGDGEIPIMLVKKTQCKITAIDGSENMLKQFTLKKEKQNI